MDSDFKPWRRKFGVVMLLMACVFMAGWVTGLTNSRRLDIPVGGSIQYQVTSDSFALTARKVRRVLSNDRSVQIVQLARLSIPHFAIVAPLTVLSAWLLLSKPRQAKRVESPITTAN